MITISQFKGLNNVASPLGLGLDWLTRADNVNIGSDGAISRREGFTEALAGAFTGAYATRDHGRLFVVDAGQLKQIHADLSATVLASGLSDAPMHWAEVNREVFFSNGPDKGIITTDNTLKPWAWSRPTAPRLTAGTGTLPAGLYQVACTYLLPDGRETGASDAEQIEVAEGSSLVIADIPQLVGCRTQVYIAPADSAQFQLAADTTATALTWSAGPDSLGMNLTTLALEPPPPGAVQPAFFAGRMYLMQYAPESDTTIVWFSEPLGFHLFSLEKSFFMVRGQGVLLAAHEAGLVIGTTTQIHMFDGDALTLLADYGAVPGPHHVIDENAPGRPLLFWSKRGLCSFPNFSNLTASRVSLAPGVRAGGAVISQGGERRYVVSLHQGDTAFNPRSIP